jgi:hypothetical protein
MGYTFKVQTYDESKKEPKATSKKTKKVTSEKKETKESS